MTLQELEVAIRDLFKQIYHKEYVAKLKLEELQTAEGIHRGYKLTLGMNNIDKPLIISFEGGEVAYLKFLRQELRDRRLGDTHYFLGYKQYNGLESCNECTEQE
jgi:hypothetical protein